MKLPLFGIVIIGIVLRAYGLDARSMWLDEATCLTIAEQTFSDILAGRGFDRHTPPLYYFTLHAWLQLLPSSLISLRLFSVVFDALCILLIGLTFGRQFNRSVGLYSALLYAVFPYSVYYGQEGRMYSLTAALVMATYWFAVKFDQNGLKPLEKLALILVAIAGMYTHYYYALSIFAITVGLSLPRLRKPHELLGWFLPMCAVGLAFIPWIQVVLKLVSSEGQVFRRFVFSVVPYTFLRFIAGYAVMPLIHDSKLKPLQTVLAHLPELLLFCAVFSVIMLFGLRSLFRQHREQLSLLLCPLVLPAAIALLVSLKTPMISERYLIVSFPHFVVLLTLGGMYLCAHNWGKLICGAAAGLTCFALYQHYFSPQFDNAQWNQVGSLLRAGGKSVVDVYVNPGHAKDVLGRNLKSPFTIQDWQQLPIELPDEFWLVERGSEKTVLDTLKQRGAEPADKQILPLGDGIRLFYFRRPIANSDLM